MVRVTCDWDDIPKREFERRMELVRKEFPDKIIYWRPTCHKNSYHIKIHGFNIQFKELIRLRRKLLDDPVRIQIDIDRSKQGLPHSILFFRKGKKRAGKWRIYEHGRRS